MLSWLISNSPLWQRGVRGDLGALENPPKSPFFKGGLESVFVWSPANGRLSPVQFPYSSTSIPEPFTLDPAVSSVGEAQPLKRGKESKVIELALMPSWGRGQS